jgi:hypothetical protein
MGSTGQTSQIALRLSVAEITLAGDPLSGAVVIGMY